MGLSFLKKAGVDADPVDQALDLQLVAHDVVAEDLDPAGVQRQQGRRSGGSASTCRTRSRRGRRGCRRARGASTRRRPPRRGPCVAATTNDLLTWITRRAGSRSLAATGSANGRRLSEMVMATPQHGGDTGARADRSRGPTTQQRAAGGQAHGCLVVSGGDAGETYLSCVPRACGHPRRFPWACEQRAAVSIRSPRVADFDPAVHLSYRRSTGGPILGVGVPCRQNGGCRTPLDGMWFIFSFNPSSGEPAARRAGIRWSHSTIRTRSTGASATRRRSITTERWTSGPCRGSTTSRPRPRTGRRSRPASVVGATTSTTRTSCSCRPATWPASTRRFTPGCAVPSGWPSARRPCDRASSRSSGSKVIELIDAFADNGRADFARDLARPLPGHDDVLVVRLSRGRIIPQLLAWFGDMLERDPGVAALPARAIAGRDRMRDVHAGRGRRRDGPRARGPDVLPRRGERGRPDQRRRAARQLDAAVRRGHHDDLRADLEFAAPPRSVPGPAER